MIYGIQGVDYAVTEPGKLIFAGSEQKTREATLKRERVNLNGMKTYFENTAWLPLIEARIEEIENEIN